MYACANFILKAFQWNFFYLSMENSCEKNKSSVLLCILSHPLPFPHFSSLSAERNVIDGEEEDVSCSPLLFKDDILTDQYFGEQQHTSIVTEKTHFGEGMHRKAFRTMMRTGMMPLFDPGHACVLKVHSSIGYGMQNNDEVIQKNYNLAVEVRAIPINM